VRAGGVNVVGRGPAAQGDADRAEGLGGRQAHGGQHRRGFVAARVTGRARGDHHVAQVGEEAQSGGGVDAEVRGVRQALDKVPGYVDTVGQKSAKRELEAVAKGLQPLSLTGCQRSGGQCRGFTESGG
jgi:hypothetical protein